MAVTWPNLITFLRLGIVPLMAGAFALEASYGLVLAFAFFWIAALTDFLDGYLARRLNQMSELGRMLDPIADKLLVAAALVMLVANRTLAGLDLVPVLVILGREILVSGLREYLSSLAVSVPVTRIAKWKTAIQMLALGALIPAPLIEAALPGFTLGATWALWLAAALTLYTGYNYLMAGLQHVERRS
ncbi:MAG: CDP-diacylglycerol--glycerol-3-phosphate 3-phosphatidyltransferase [Alphaproteobacteria bacterium]|nr:CDP-diacylglycerol--glycerol-3-phosphate 3-phosphatidyltransferase [Alphaproteobacteria bacterium]